MCKNCDICAVQKQINKYYCSVKRLINLICVYNKRIPSNYIFKIDLGTIDLLLLLLIKQCEVLILKQ